MGIIKRQGLKTSIVSYGGVLLGVIFFIFVFPHLVDAKYLGLIGLLQNLMYVFATLPALGIPHILLRFFPGWKETPMLRSFNSFALLSIALSSVLFIVLYILFRDLIIRQYQHQSALFIPYYYAIIPLVIVFAYNQYFELYSMVHLRVALPAFLREILTRVLLILSVFLFAFHWLSESQFVVALIFSYLLSFIVLAMYTRHSHDFGLDHPRHFWKKSTERKEALQYGAYMLLLNGFTNIHNFLDGIILPAYLGLSTLGIYLRPMILGVMIQIPYRAVGLIAIPVIREAMVENNMEKVRELNKSIGLNLFLIGTFLFTLLIANTEGIFRIFPPEYGIARNVLYIIAVGRLLDMAFGLNSEIINYSSYYRHIILYSFLMMALTITLNILLIPRFGMEGAAWAVSCSLILFNLLKTAFIWHTFRFHCFSRAYIPVMFVSAGTLLLLYFIPFLNLLPHHMFFNACANIALKGLLGCIIFLIPVYLLRISSDFNHFVQLVFSGKILKGGSL